MFCHFFSYACLLCFKVVPSAPLAGDTDYSDPFDVRLEHRPEPDLGPVPCENNGYMEPYEAQRVITGQWTVAALQLTVICLCPNPFFFLSNVYIFHFISQVLFISDSHIW